MLERTRKQPRAAQLRAFAVMSVDAVAQSCGYTLGI